MEWTTIFEAAGWMLFSFVKFIVMPSTAIASGLPPWWVFVYSAGGAVLGLVAMQPVVRSLFGWRTRVRRRKGKLAFTPNRRRIVRVKQNFGLLGIAFLGGLVGVPVGALLAFKYFENRSDTLPVMVLAYAAWSALLTTLSALALI
ncbi:MAG TPA: hypothetical protein DHV07_03515 [Flavobacteriales bacterium]|jgi:hypothetical protein|nr:hypothetical protein [Flavobacteriales bacterium]